jgi:hypothetical protein
VAKLARSKSAGNPAVIGRLFSLPPLSAKEASLVAEALSELAPELPPPAEDASARLRLVEAPLAAVLQLDTLHTHGSAPGVAIPQSFSGGPFDVRGWFFAMPTLISGRMTTVTNSSPCQKAKRSV